MPTDVIIPSGVTTIIWTDNDVVNAVVADEVTLSVEPQGGNTLVADTEIPSTIDVDTTKVYVEEGGVQTLYKQTLMGEISFTVGAPGYVPDGTSNFQLLDITTQLPLLQNVTVKLFREGELQQPKNTERGYIHDPSTGIIVVFPKLRKPEDIIIWVFELNVWTQQSSL